MGVFSDRSFLYNKFTRTFTGCVSHLRGGKDYNIFHKIDGENVEQGLSIFSTKTEDIVEFVVTKVHKIDGFIVQYELEPTKQTLKHLPSAHGLKIELKNE